jgi:hypothetical protein
MLARMSSTDFVHTKGLGLSDERTFYGGLELGHARVCATLDLPLREQSKPTLNPIEP